MSILTSYRSISSEHRARDVAANCVHSTAVRYSSYIDRVDSNTFACLWREHAANLTDLQTRACVRVKRRTNARTRKRDAQDINIYLSGCPAFARATRSEEPERKVMSIDRRRLVVQCWLVVFEAINLLQSHRA